MSRTVGLNARKMGDMPSTSTGTLFAFHLKYILENIYGRKYYSGPKFEVNSYCKHFITTLDIEKD